MNTQLSPFKIAALIALTLLLATLWAVANFDPATAVATVTLANAGGAVTLEKIMEAMDKVEGKLKNMSDTADGQMQTLGKVSTDTKTALENIGNTQRELADRLLQLEQKGPTPPKEGDKAETWGAQLTKSKTYEAFAGGHTQKMRVEVKNTLTGSDTTVAPSRRPGVVGGAFLPLSIESFLPSVPATSNAIEFTRENVFTNAAAEAAEGAAKAESSITWTLVNMPISTVAHWIKISRQLAADAPALAAYVDLRMRYGVNVKADAQLAIGDGTAPNISGIFDAGNFTAHGYNNAALAAISANFKKLILIRKMIADSWSAGFPADAIMLNPTDWATIELELLTTAAGQQLYSVQEGQVPRLFNVPVVQAVGVAADTVAVGAFGQAYMVHNREGVVVDMSESDSDNFTKNLITIRAERRLALATERPAAVRAGDLTPA